MSSRRLAVLAALPLALFACSSDDSSSSDEAAPADAGGPTVTCRDDPRVDAYAANLTKTSASGRTSVTLLASEPAPPVRGTNTWTVNVTDGADAPIANATLTVTPFMPDHGHGSSVKPAIASKGDGTYEIASLYLFMPGVWRITIANDDDAVDFFFCVAG